MFYFIDNLRIIDIVKNIQLPLANSQREIMHFIQRFDDDLFVWRNIRTVKSDHISVEWKIP